MLVAFSVVSHIDARDIWGIVQPRLNTDMERIELGFGPFDAGIGI